MTPKDWDAHQVRVFATTGITPVLVCRQGVTCQVSWPADQMLGSSDHLHRTQVQLMSHIMIYD